MTNMSILRTQIENRLFKTVKGISGSMKTATVLVLAVLLLFSCEKEVRKPAGILSKEEMVSVLTELYIVEERMNRLNLPADTSKLVFEVMEANVYEKTGVPDSVFKSSFDYYLDDPKEMELIYTALVDSLQLKEQRTPRRTLKRP
jgi:hypothetical protein